MRKAKGVHYLYVRSSYLVISLRTFWNPLVVCVAPLKHGIATLGTSASRDPTTRDGDYLSAIDGLIVRGMSIKNGGGECIRLRGE